MERVAAAAAFPMQAHGGAGLRCTFLSCMGTSVPYKYGLQTWEGEAEKSGQTLWLFRRKGVEDMVVRKTTVASIAACRRFLDDVTGS